MSDEASHSAELDRTIDCLAQRLIAFADAGYQRPRTFLGVGGMKIFRDEIWGGLKVIFRADHKAYRRMGAYDFPHRNVPKRILMGLLYLITGLPGIRSRFPAMIKRRMIEPYRKVLGTT